MSRLFVNQLADGQGVDEVFLASEKQLRPNRAGQLYLQVRLSDKTGSLTAMMWNANQRQFDSFSNGDFVRVQGTSQLYNGGMQIIAQEIDPADSARVDESHFITMSAGRVEKLTERLGEIIGQIRNVHLRTLGQAFLDDAEFMGRFRKAPAGVKNHHAYHGGLLEHVVAVMDMAVFVGEKYERLDADLLIMGAFLHDAGKIEELCYEPDLGYRDSGQLLGHMVMGVELLQAKINQLQNSSGEEFPVNLTTQLKHLILSHHGQLEFGSPVLPMTLEAIALTQIDNLDAKIHSVTQIIDEDANAGSPWTTYQPSLGRKIFKGNC